MNQGKGCNQFGLGLGQVDNITQWLLFVVTVQLSWEEKSVQSFVYIACWKGAIKLPYLL